MSEGLDLGGSVKGLIEGLGNQLREWINWWRKNNSDKQPERILDEMLRNPKFRFRETHTLAKAIHDTTEGYTVTQAILRKLGARHNIREKDTWTMDKYWKKDPKGKWTLKIGVKPGEI